MGNRATNLNSIYAKREYRMNPRNNSHVARLASDSGVNVFSVHPLGLHTFAIRILRV